MLRDKLRAHLWGEETFVDFERGLNFCVLQVRAALGDSSDNPRFIQTVPRKGYRFIAPVATSVPPSDFRPAQQPPPPPGTSVPPSDIRPAQGSPSAHARAWQPHRVAALSVGALLVLAPLAWLLLGSERPDARGAIPRAFASRCCPSRTSRATRRTITSRTASPTSSSRNSDA